jgi:hypothetical protein
LHGALHSLSFAAFLLVSVSSPFDSRSSAVAAMSTQEQLQPWQRPPFERGNRASVRHGIHSRRVVAPLEQELVAGVLVDRPDLNAHPETVQAWARAEASAQLAWTWIAENGMVDGKGKPRDLLRYCVSFERLARDLRRDLGLDPRSDAELQRERAQAVAAAFDVEAVAAAGREAIARRAAQDQIDSTKETQT